MLLAVLVLLAVHCFAEPQENKDIQRRVIGGIPISIDKAPFAVSYGTACSGVILTTDEIPPPFESSVVLTSKACGIQNFIHAKTATLLSTTGVIILVDRHITHPDYDLQLVVLQKPIQFDQNAQGVSLGNDDMIKDNANVQIVGWGQYIDNQQTSHSGLTSVKVNIFSNKDKCNHNGTKTFCGYGNGQAGACIDDEGGPVTLNEKLLGIITTPGCGKLNTPDVYTKVTTLEVRDWIGKILKEEMKPHIECAEDSNGNICYCRHI